MNWRRELDALQRDLLIARRGINLLQEQVVDRDNKIAELTKRIEACEEYMIPKPEGVAPRASCHHYTRGMWVVEINGERHKEGDHLEGKAWYTREGPAKFCAEFNGEPLEADIEADKEAA